MSRRRARRRAGSESTRSERPRTPAQRAPETIEVTIERLASDGAGIGRHPDGRIAFVPFSAPGDRARVRITQSKRSLVRAELIELLEPSAHRAAPRCEHFTRCGGCSWQHIAYEAQIEAKRDIVIDALRRIGGLEVRHLEVTPSPDPYEYRGRARMRVEAGRPGFRAAGAEEGSGRGSDRRSGRGRRAVSSPRIVSVSDCPVLAPPLRAALRTLASESRDDGEWELALGMSTAELPDGVRVLKLDAGAEDGPPITLQAGGERVRIVPGGFAQANPLLFDTLVDSVLAACERGERLLELYAGAGFFTLPLARRFAHLTAVESSADAVAQLREAAVAADLDSIESWCDDAETFLRGDRAAQARPDVVFMDPPRTGAGSEVIAAVDRSTASRLVYLSCDAATLARDLARLVEAGWHLHSVEAFDLFPQTPHVETLAVLKRDRNTEPAADRTGPT